MLRISLILLLLTGPLAAADVAPLLPSEAAEALGARVLSADAVPLGKLIAARPGPDGGLSCIVELDAALEARTSALIVDGLLRAPDGSLRLAESAAVLADRMRLTLPPG